MDGAPSFLPGQDEEGDGGHGYGEGFDTEEAAERCRSTLMLSKRESGRAGKNGSTESSADKPQNCLPASVALKRSNSSLRSSASNGGGKYMQHREHRVRMSYCIPRYESGILAS